jgi:hypothetical protein
MESQKIKKLDETNYLTWSTECKLALRAKGLSKLVEYEKFEDYYNQTIKSEIQEEYLFEIETIKLAAITEEEKRGAIFKLNRQAPYDTERVIWEREKLKERKQWIVDDEKVSAFIQQNVETIYTNQLKTCSTAYEMWTLLKKECKISDGGLRFVLFNTFIKIRFDPNETLSNYLARSQAATRKNDRDWY